MFLHNPQLIYSALIHKAVCLRTKAVLFIRILLHRPTKPYALNSGVKGLIIFFSEEQRHNENFCSLQHHTIWETGCKIKALTIIHKTNGANIENYRDSLCFPCLLATALMSCTGYLPCNWFSICEVSLYSSKGSSMGLH